LKYKKFVIDANLGRLLKYLRFAGFDCVSANHIGDPAILRICQKDNRLYLSRNKTIPLLLKKLGIKIIQSVEYHAQIKEIAQITDFSPENYFTRCIECNNELSDQIPDYVQKPDHVKENSFKFCRHCKKLFWKGTHYQHMCSEIEKALNLPD